MKTVVLSRAGMSATSIHGDRLQREREEAIYDFERDNKSILVATPVAIKGEPFFLVKGCQKCENSGSRRGPGPLEPLKNKKYRQISVIDGNVRLGWVTKLGG